ncbi:MAG: DUF1349 domain-containing protein, partial [Candidatus Poribacteria bacterium]
GNPFFIEEVIRSLIEQGMIYQQDDKWIAKDEISDINVPDTIQSVILSRVDRLQAEAKYVLQCASVIGRLFKHRLLDHLTQHERELNKYITDFEERELVYRERMIPELEYAFKHALTQEATYQSILERKRKEFHLQVAQGIEKLYQERLEEFYEELAEHYSKSDDVEKALDYLIKAGQKAKERYANETAISYFQSALETIEQYGITRNEIRLKALQELGKIYNMIGRLDKAEEEFDKAIKLSKEMDISGRELAMLYLLKAEALNWQRKHEDVIQCVKMGLEILEDDLECIEAALLNRVISAAYINQGKPTPEHVYMSKKFVKKLEYSERLIDVYTSIAWYSFYIERNSEEALEWCELSIDMAKKHNDINGLALPWCTKGDFLYFKGDFINTISLLRKSLDIYEHIGDANGISLCYIGITAPGIVGTSITLGNIKEAKLYMSKYLDLANQEQKLQGDPMAYCIVYSRLGEIYMIQGQIELAILNYEKVLETAVKTDMKWSISWAYFGIGKAYMKKGNYQYAVDSFISSFHNNNNLINGALSFLEEIYTNLKKTDDFKVLCDELKSQYKDIPDQIPSHQWYLESTELPNEYHSIIHGINESWQWIDEFDDCSYNIGEEKIEIHASNGRNLSSFNFSTPRLMQEASGDFAVEVIINSVSEDKPQQGGLLIWKDKNNFIRFEKGTHGKREMHLEGCVNGKYRVAGRGLLPTSDNDETYLRLERSGDEFSSYCSVDGENWFTCGKMTLPMEDPIQIGIHAIGMIDRTIYCGEYKEGTATLFRNFRIWTK